MKLAEALFERKNHKTRMEALKTRVYRSARVQEGEAPAEPPLELLERLEREVDAFVSVVTRINHANARTELPDGRTLTEALVRRDMLRYLHLVHTNLADKAAAPADRYSRREIRLVPAIDILGMRKSADELAMAHRLLDVRIQALNWDVELT